jgi:hypothetical protein
MTVPATEPIATMIHAGKNASTMIYLNPDGTITWVAHSDGDEMVMPTNGAINDNTKVGGTDA